MHTEKLTARQHRGRRLGTITNLFRCCPEIAFPQGLRVCIPLFPSAVSPPPSHDPASQSPILLANIFEGRSPPKARLALTPEREGRVNDGDDQSWSNFLPPPLLRASFVYYRSLHNLLSPVSLPTCSASLDKYLYGRELFWGFA